MSVELEASLARLISIPSITSDTAACHEILNYVRGEVQQHGLFIHEEMDSLNPWFFATTQDTKQPDILFAAHLDVVPATPDLFVMRKHGGNFYGRGVYDMKLAAACYLELLRRHSEKLHELNIGFLFTTDEEAGGFSTFDALKTGLRPKIAFLPDGGDNWAVEKRAKGFLGLELTAHGRNAHASRPWEGTNALHTLLDVTSVLRSHYPQKSDPTANTLTVNMLRAGEAINQLPDQAMAAVDFRSFHKEDLVAYRQLVDRLAKEYSLDVRVSQGGEPLLFDEQAPHVDGFLRALQAHTGQDEIRYCESYGASDGRYFALHALPCVIMEPRGGGRHSPEEWLDAEDFLHYYHLIERWVLTKY